MSWESTTIGIISSIVKKTSGTLKYGVDIDKDIEKAKQFLGVVPQEFNFNIFETCLQIVINQGGYYGVPYLEAKKEPCIFDQLGLTEKTNEISKNYLVDSKGA